MAETNLAARTGTESCGGHACFWWRAFFLLASAAFALLLVWQPAPWRVWAEAGTAGDMSLKQTIAFWTWLAGAGGIVIMAGLATLCPWWTAAPAPDEPTSCPSSPGPRWFRPLVIAAMLAGGIIAGPTLGHSIWDDENENLNWYTVGRFERQGDEGEVRFKSWPWHRTVYSYSTPNNHVFHSILSRACNEIWRVTAEPQGWQFHHVAIRIPAFLAALAAIAAVALLLKGFGFPAAGVAAAWFLALQPWFTEHASVARGYTMVMLFAIVALIALRRALRCGTWRWWGGFALAQFFALWTYPGALFFFAPLNLAAVVLIWRRPPPVSGPVRTQLSRWFCVNSLAAAALLPLLLPLLPQMKKYMATLVAAPADIGADWLRDVFWLFSGGAPWLRGESSPAWKYLDIQLVGGSFGTAGIWGLGAVVAIPFLLGVWRLARSGGVGLAASVCMIAAPALQFLYAKHQRIFIWEWYVIFALPFIAVFWGLGAAWIAGLLGKLSPSRPWIAPLTGTALVVLYAVTTQPVRAWQAVHPRSPHRESALLTRPDPGDYRSEENRRILTFSIFSSSPSYDPNLIVPENAAELVLLCLLADREARPLAGSMGHMEFMEQQRPREFALVHDRRLFGRRTKLGAADTNWDRHVFFYTPGSASKYDFTTVLSPDELAWVEANVMKKPEAVFTEKKK
jgi:hypothetical protein